MYLRRSLYMLALVTAMLPVGLSHAPARALHEEANSAAPSCHTSSQTLVSFADMAAALNEDAKSDKNSLWRCDDQFWRADFPVSWLLFDATQWQDQEHPRFFFSRITRFEAISFAALDRDGTMRTLRYAESDGRPFAAGPVFQLALPEITDQTKAVIMRVDKAHSVPLLTEARLTQLSNQADWSQLEVAFLAFIVGMMVLPLLLDANFIIILRARYVALHAGMTLAMIGYVVFGGGLVSLIAQLPVSIIAIAAPLFWSTAGGLTALFIADFLEGEFQSELMRKLTRAAGWFALLVPGFLSLQLEATQSFDDRGYFLTSIVYVTMITVAIGRAMWRGSMSARFLALGWAPIILASLERALRGLGFYIGPSSLDQLLYLACGILVIMLSLAIAQRLHLIRSQRDAALREARMLEELSERDHLTGLLNRRVVEERFAQLRADGFDTFALIDLDRFKQVNDDFGHQIGDQVLVACANALRGDEERDTIAVRLGGEEFVVLLRGHNTYARAEALRQMIPIHIEDEVDEVDRPVTASMGLIELPRASYEIFSFQELYSRSDQLLYHAKASGRDRSCFERLKVFKAAPPKREAASTTA